MWLIGIDHVLLAMPEGGEEQARWFYGKVLGLDEVDKPAPLASLGGCWFEAPGVHVHLGIQQGFVAALKAHPAFLVSDLEELARALADADVKIMLDTALDEVPRFYACDPFGNRIEFIQNGYGFSQRRFGPRPT